MPGEIPSRFLPLCFGWYPPMTLATSPVVTGCLHIWRNAARVPARSPSGLPPYAGQEGFSFATLRSRPPITASVGLTFASHLKPSAGAASSGYPRTAPKPKLTPEERRARLADKLITIRLRMAIWRELNECRITTPAAIGEALGMLPAEATSLLTRRHWREGDGARLQAAAARLGAQVAPMARI